MLALVVAAKLTAVTTLTNGINFIDKNDAGCLFLGLLKQVTHTGGAHAHKHFYKLTAANGKEGHLGLTGNSLG